MTGLTEAAKLDRFFASLDRLRDTLGTAAAGDTGAESRRRKYGIRNAPRPSNRDLSAGGEPSPGAAPQGEAPLAGTGSGMSADREGPSSEGEGTRVEAGAVDRGGEPSPVVVGRGVTQSRKPRADRGTTHASAMVIVEPWRNRPAIAPSAKEMSAEDDRQLVRLVRDKGLGLTAIAPLLRKTYATLATAMDRLELTRVPQ